MHADYFRPMKPRIRVFDYRIEFLNPGAPSKSIESFTREDISLPRNPILAKLFRSVRLAEKCRNRFHKDDPWLAYLQKAGACFLSGN